MERSLKVGDRVRVTDRNRMYGYRTGDTGTVTGGPFAYPNGTVYYFVAMDRQEREAATNIFLADEIVPNR